MNNLLNKYAKGEYEYAKYNRNKIIVFTAILFAISISLYIAGYITTKSNKNYLTIVAILGLLPASKYLVSVIMNFKIKITDSSFKAAIDKNIGSLNGLFHILFTSYDTNFYFKHLVITSNSIIALSDKSSIDEKKFKEYMEKHLKIEGIDNILIKIFTDEATYLKRLEELNKLENATETNAKLNMLINSISL